MARIAGGLRPATSLIAIVVLVAACGGGGAEARPDGSVVTLATAAPASPPAASAAPSTNTTASPSTAAAPTPTPPTFERPTASPLEVVQREPALKELWSASGPKGTRPWTWSPEVDPQGRIWAASSFDDAFWIVDRDGTFFESWGGAGSGTGDGQFRLPAEGNGYGDIIFRPDGGFYVADSGNSRVQQFDADRGFVRAFGSFGTDPGEFVQPLDIDIDDAGNVYVLDGARLDVQVFTPDGEYLRTAATHVGPYEAVDGAGNVYVVDNDPVVLYRYTPDGVVDLAVDLKPVVGFATGLDVGADGDLYLATSDSGGSTPTYLDLLRLGPDGSSKQIWPTGAEGVAVDPAGDRVYLTGSDGFSDIRAYALPSD